MSSRRSRYHVPNLERALKIIELLSRHPGGLNTSEIAAMLNVSRNSVFRITATLNDFGYILRDEETKSYQLSKKLLTLGYSALSEETLIEKALGPMRKLRDQYRETVPLGVIHEQEGLVIEVVSGIHAFRFVLEPGRRFHLHTAAPGKAILAYLPDEERDPVIAKMGFTGYNERTITNRNDFLKELDRTRERGYAVDRAEEIDGMHCVGAPVFNRHGLPVAAIWITGPSVRIRQSEFETIGPNVRKIADQISKSLGFQGTDQT